MHLRVRTLCHNQRECVRCVWPVCAHRMSPVAGALRAALGLGTRLTRARCRSLCVRDLVEEDVTSSRRAAMGDEGAPALSMPPCSIYDKVRRPERVHRATRVAAHPHTLVVHHLKAARTACCCGA
jgi:hypothetical protein